MSSSPRCRASRCIGAVANQTIVLFRIIVGVKYCFRYNARQRARANGEEEPVDMQTMPRPHRRRREKKLMTPEEVNERFPSQKYKSWRAHRESMGLPSEGGIKTAPNSRPGSVKHFEAVVSPIEESPATPTDRSAVFKEVLGSSAAAKELPSPSGISTVANETNAGPVPADTSSENENKRLSDISDIEQQKESDHDQDHDQDDDDDEHMHAVVPEDLLNSVGDSCAICIDVIDDDDDIRGLSCGHAFHAQCLDPWLTSRRACCPLCKADYYTPKPRPELESNNSDGSRSGVHRQGGEPAVPQETYIGPPFHRRMIFSPGRFMAPYYGSGQGRGRTNNNSGSSTAAQNGSDAGAAGGNRWLRNPLRGVTLPSINRGRNGGAEPTPGALEAGAPSRAVTPQRPTPAPSPLQGAGTH